MFVGETHIGTKPDVYSIEGFIAWAEQQPAGRTYNWKDVCGCAAHEYLVAMGRRYDGSFYSNGGGRLSSVFPSTRIYHQVCKTEPHTFGAALTRALAALAAR